jgi:hypothetical protein
MNLSKHSESWYLLDQQTKTICLIIILYLRLALFRVWLIVV